MQHSYHERALALLRERERDMPWGGEVLAFGGGEINPH
jgi:hypothetical protein